MFCRYAMFIELKHCVQFGPTFCLLQNKFFQFSFNSLHLTDVIFSVSHSLNEFAHNSRRTISITSSFSSDEFFVFTTRCSTIANSVLSSLRKYKRYLNTFGRISSQEIYYPDGDTISRLSIVAIDIFALFLIQG